MNVLQTALAASVDLGATAVDACTLNNALNVAQLTALIVIVRWLRPQDGPPAR